MKKITNVHEIPTITLFERKEFRAWLRIHHKKEHKIGLVLHKRHTGKPCPSHRALMEEAICFGWIDTTIKRLDEDTFIRYFSRRTTKSTWSDNTLRYGRELIAKGKMTAEGMRFYELGRAKPTLDAGIPKDPSMPPELKRALATDTPARRGFEAFTPSTKRMLYREYLRAKLPATRQRRIEKILEQARTTGKGKRKTTNSKR